MNCITCQKQFDITSSDREFYAKMDVPEPVRCPNCRQHRRIAWRVERSLHYRKCDLCGVDHLSSYTTNAPFPVYCLDCWYSDKWDQLKDGRDFDFTRPFFEQFEELQKLSPRPSLYITQGTVIDSYVNAATNVKNCYLSFGANDSEDTYYSNFFVKCYSVCDSTEMLSCEKCHDCVNCDNCFNVIGSNNSRGCRDSIFLEDCSGCNDCFGCVNLRNKQFCLWNEQLTEDEYKKRIGKINLRSREIYDRTKKVFDKFREERGIYQYYHGVKNVDSIGDSLTRCKNVKFAFDCSDCEDCKYVTRLNGAKDCMDVDWFGFGGLELVYNSASCGRNSNNLKFCNQVWNGCSHLEYCDSCVNSCKELFACISLTNKNHCILNKQYSPEEYKVMKAKIIDYIRNTKEYGQFFDPKTSHVPYYDSLAKDYYPLTKEEALEQGFRWDEEEDKKTAPASIEFPDDLNAVDEKITKETLACTDCKRNYKIVAQELKMYQEMGVPLPNKCFECRLTDRLERKNSRQIYDRKCDQCQVDLKSTYASDRPEKVLCEECYKKEIY